MERGRSVRDARRRVPRAILGLTWREHIGGRWAVSLLGFAIVFPVGFLAVFANVRLATPERLLQWAAISLASLAVLGLVWWLASVTLLRNRRERSVPISLVVLVGAVSGAVRSAIVVALTYEVGLLEPPVVARGCLCSSHGYGCHPTGCRNAVVGYGAVREYSLSK